MEEGRTGNMPESFRPDRWMAVQIVIGNAVPVVGVWVLGWSALRPMFFYWLDGLLALWGLGVVAAVVSNRDGPISKASGMKLWLTWAAVICLLFMILALPSAIAGAYIFGFLGRDAGDVCREIFTGYGVWLSLLIVIGSYIGQTIGELRWKPDLTIKDTGKERANLFIHRTLLLAMLVFWQKWGQPSRWALAIYVLAVACLYTFTQLFPDRYLQMIGFKTKHRGGLGHQIEEKESRMKKKKGDVKK